MLRFFMCFMLILLLPIAASSAPVDQSKKIKRVIYVTLDGTRWQDVFNDHPYFPKLWGKYAKHGIFYGAPGSKTMMEVASIPVSLPSYQSQMAGIVEPCDGNECGRVPTETVLENLIHRGHFAKKDVAVFSSWDGIGLADQMVEKTVIDFVGRQPVVDPFTQQPDAIMAALNAKQAADFPVTDGNDRFDYYTFPQALHYLEKYQPRFLWISFNDPDEMAHENNLEGYHQALKYADDSLDQLFTLLKKLKLDKETLVIVTTDHGRGDGEFWTVHGMEHPESKRTWGFVMNGALEPVAKNGDVYYYSTLSVRPTIEKVLI